MNHRPVLSRRAALHALALPAGAPLLALLGACASGDAARRDFQLLTDADAAAAPPPRAAPLDRVLLLDLAAAPTLYASTRMVYSADGVSRSYFQFAQWSERPSHSLLRLAEARLASTRYFRAVASSSAGVRGDLLLTLRLEDLYLDDSRQPQARLAFGATLIDWRQRRLIARRGFDKAIPVSGPDAAGLAAAAGQAVGLLLGELVMWVARSAESSSGT